MRRCALVNILTSPFSTGGSFFLSITYHGVTMKITTYSDLAEWVGAFDTKALSLLIIKGSAGIGKTYTIEQALLQASPVVFKGHATPLSIYKKLSENPDAIVIFDDVDELLKNKTTVALLKQICEAKEQKTVYYSTTMGDFEATFTSTNKVIMIFNDLRVLGENMRAVMDRAVYIDFCPDKAEVLRQLKTFADDQDVLDFLEQNIDHINLTFRSYTKGVQLHRAGLDYQEYLRSEFEDDEMQRIIEEIIDFPTDERNDAWVKMTGKTIRTLQRKIKEFKRRDII